MARFALKIFPKINVRSVFVRCAGMMALTTIVVASGMAFMASSTVDTLARQGVVDQAARLAGTNAASLAAPMRFGIQDKIDEVVAGTLDAAGKAGRAVVAVGADGVLLGASGAEDVRDGLVALGRASLEAGEAVSGENGLWVAVPVRASPEDAASGILAIAMSDAAARASVLGDKIAVALVALILFAVMMSVTLLLLKRTLGRPLAAVGDAVNRVGQGDYDTPVPLTDRRDELGAIARDLDGLVAVLKQGHLAEEARQAQHEAQVRVVSSLGDGLDALARGVLTARLAEAFPADYEALRGNFNRAANSLNEAIAAVHGNVQSIGNGADEIAKASDDLSRRTETQAATLEQTAAALDELLASVRSAAKNAEEADAAVGQAREMATRNDDVMRSAMSAMGEIEKSSEQIGEIITVIDDIAFQTNLLALNAGVEAARAGSSGKGFAVVASEVRALAQRSSDAARQIKDLISGSTDQVKKGARLVEQAGSALEQVVGQVAEISDLVSGIARGAAEQSEGLNEINTGVGQLDQVTQQNAAMVEESTAAAHMLRTEAGNMTELVSRFEFDDPAAPQRHAAPRESNAA